MDKLCTLDKILNLNKHIIEWKITRKAALNKWKTRKKGNKGEKTKE